jgi:two-component sensor histidine kinase/uncharacterized membrane protein YvlD (DUF360 family)
MQMKERLLRNPAQILAHVLVWGTLAVIPFLADRNIPFWMHFRGFVSFYIALLIFYLNYFILIDNFLYKNKFWQFIIINIALFVLSYFLSEIIQDIIPSDFHFKPENKPGGNPGPPKKPYAFIITRSLISSIFSLGASIGVKSIGRINKLESERVNLKNEKLQAEISGLKNQINPHFLFNTLNNIYVQIQKSPENAQDSVHKLSKLLRYLLYETNADVVPLKGEIDFLNNYIELMNLRQGKNVEVETEFIIASHEIQIAPLLFLPLVENAYKHGVSATEKSFIQIHLAEKEKELVLDISNSNFPKKDDHDKSSGFGLKNFSKRLELLYPDKHSFQSQVESGIYKVKLRIDL